MENKKRLIDANELMDVLKENHDNIMQDPEVKANVKWREAVVFHSVSQAIRHAPTVDAVEVVRCKDCTYWIDEDGTRTKDGITYARCNAHNHYVEGRHWGWCPSENDFCSFGERRKS